MITRIEDRPGLLDPLAQPGNGPVELRDRQHRAPPGDTTPDRLAVTDMHRPVGTHSRTCGLGRRSAISRRHNSLRRSTENVEHLWGYMLDRGLSVAHCRRTLNAALNDAVRRGILASNPVASAETPYRPGAELEHRRADGFTLGRCRRSSQRAPLDGRNVTGAAAGRGARALLGRCTPSRYSR